MKQPIPLRYRGVRYEGRSPVVPARQCVGVGRYRGLPVRCWVVESQVAAWWQGPASSLRSRFRLVYRGVAYWITPAQSALARSSVPLAPRDWLPLAPRQAGRSSVPIPEIPSAQVARDRLHQGKPTPLEQLDAALAQPNLGQSNLEPSKPDQPSLEQSNLAQLDSGQPNLGKPNLEQLDSGQPNLGKPNLEQLDSGQQTREPPDFGKADLDQQPLAHQDPTPPNTRGTKGSWVASNAPSLESDELRGCVLPEQGSAASRFTERQLPIAVGSRGPHVAIVQGWLRRRGVWRRRVTTYFDPLMREAVRDFQRQCGLRADGVVDAKTYAHLQRPQSSSYP